VSRSPEPPGEKGSGPPLASLPLLVLTLGLVSVVLILASDRLRLRSLARSDARVEAVAEIRTRLTSAHLWVEEYVTGDEVDLQGIYDDLDWSLATTDALLGPAVDSRAELRLPPSDVALRRSAERLRGRVTEFRQLSARRHSGFDNGLDVGIGSGTDVAYDALFAEAMNATEDLRLALSVDRQDESSRTRRIFLIIVLGWSLIVVTASIGLWFRERQRWQAREDLDASRRDLAQTQKMDAVGRLAGGIAHDINNYLAAIRGHCELVRMKGAADAERTIERMGLVMGTIDKTSELLDRLLAFSRPRALRREVVDLNELLREMERIARPAVGEAVDLQLDLSSAPAIVEVDPAQIEQAVLNLVVNARDALGGGGRLVISTEARVIQASGTVTLSVEDDGDGMTPDVMDRIFEPFFSAKEGKGHSGLGLAVVYAAVTQNGGRIVVDSVVGRGTVFRLTFPAIAAPDAMRRRRAGAVEDPEAPRGNESILLVDDNDDFRDATRELLEELGYRVTPAGNAAEALVLCEERGGDFALLLSDLVMPGMSGDDLCGEVGRRWGMTTLLMTGRSVGPGTPREMLRKLAPVAELARAVRGAIDGKSTDVGSS